MHKYNKYIVLLLTVIIISFSLFKFLPKVILTTKPLLENDIKVFVINLDRTPQRYQKITQQLQKNGLNYERFNAIDGYLLEIVDDKGLKFSGQDIKSNPKLLLPNSYYTIRCPSEDVEYYSDFSMLARTLTAGEFGVYCSHREIWYKMVQENIPYALILEDDSVFSTNFREEFLKAISTLPSYWDFVYLHMILHAKTKALQNVYNNPLLKKIRTNNIGFTSTAAYMISLPAAKALLGYSKKFTWPIDHVLERSIVSKKMEAYAIWPFPINPEGDSIIGEMFPKKNDIRN